MDTQSLRPLLATSLGMRQALVLFALLSMTALLLVLAAAIVVGSGVNMPVEQQLIGPFRWLPLEGLG